MPDNKRKIIEIIVVIKRYNSVENILVLVKNECKYIARKAMVNVIISYFKKIRILVVFIVNFSFIIWHNLY